MTTLPARSLSGDHLGKWVSWRGEEGPLHEVHQRDAFVSIVFGIHLRHIHPKSPITLEDT